MTANMVLEYIAQGLDWLADKTHNLGDRIFLMDADSRLLLDSFLVIIGSYLLIIGFETILRVNKRFPG